MSLTADKRNEWAFNKEMKAVVVCTKEYILNILDLIPKWFVNKQTNQPLIVPTKTSTKSSRVQMARGHSPKSKGELITAP